MRCDGCRHWQSEGTEDWTAERIGFGWCHAVRERWTIEENAAKAPTEQLPADEGFDDWNPTTRPKPGTYDAARVDALEASKAYVQDGSSYRAELFTAPDFFCALFAAQTKTGSEA